MKRFRTLYFFLQFVTLIKAKEAHDSPQKAVLDILNSPDYNRNLRPEIALFEEDQNDQNGRTAPNATVLKVSMFVRKIDRIDDLRMEFTTQLTVRQIWKDSRIRYPVKNNYSFSEYVTLDDSVGDRLWTPDLFFSNEASGYIHKLMKPNSYKRVYPSGKVLWSSRATITFSCPMDFHFFPFDKQVCIIRLGVFSETKKDIVMKWEDGNNAIGFSNSKNHLLPKFDLMSHETGTCGTHKQFSEYIGEFSCIYIELYLRRQSSFYIAQIYAPSVMCVMLSWVSFWLGESISARLSLTLTLLLTMSTQITGRSQELPQVSYMKALDIWTGTCMMFGALAILETATVAYILQGRISNATRIFNLPLFEKGGNLKVEKKPTQKFSLTMDKICSFLFPLSFFLFTVVYILVYVIGENHPIIDKDLQS